MQKTKTAFILILAFALLSHFNVSAQIGNETSDAIFAKGNKAPFENFTGIVWVTPLMANDSIFNCVMGSVPFEPGARSNWYTHPAGQILLVTEGTGYTQERGKQIQVIHKGDVIK